MPRATLLHLLAAAAAAAPVFPPADDPPPERDFGTKTPYQSQSAGPLTPPPPGCGPALMVNALVRHGARHTGNIEEMGELKEKILSAAGASAPAWLRNWSYPAPLSMAAQLLPLGMEEGYGIAHRLRAAVPTAFPTADRPWTPAAYAAKATCKTRAQQTAASFSQAATAGTGPLPGGSQPVAIDVKSAAEDVEMRFHKACPKWSAGVDDNTTAKVEVTKYAGGAEMATARASTTARAGVNPSALLLSADDVELVWEACAYESILRGEDATWCALLDGPAHRAVSYLRDLELWYELGGGHAVNGEMAMYLLRAFFAGFDAGAAAGYGGAWRFAHAETTTPFLSILGAFEGLPHLTADRRDERRAFRSHVVAPFAANVVATLHRCDGAVPLRARFLIHEREVTLPGCGGEVYCDLSGLRAHLDGPLTKWNYTEVCGGACACEWE